MTTLHWVALKDGIIQDIKEVTWGETKNGKADHSNTFCLKDAVDMLRDGRADKIEIHKANI